MAQLLTDEGISTLWQIVDKLEQELKNCEYLKRALKDESFRQNLSTSLLDHLKCESELKTFIDYFKDARNLQICFIIDVTKTSRHFKNQIAILDIERATKHLSFTNSLIISPKFEMLFETRCQVMEVASLLRISSLLSKISSKILHSIEE